MSHAERIAREAALTDALREIDLAIGDEQPEPQALRIIEAIKRLRDQQPARVMSLERRDYMAEAQYEARKLWAMKHANDGIGPSMDAVAGIDTPLGRLKAVVWKQEWAGAVRGNRIAWAGEYYLDDAPITVAEIKAAGLAQRPTTRNRGRSKHQ